MSMHIHKLQVLDYRTVVSLISSFKCGQSSTECHIVFFNYQKVYFKWKRSTCLMHKYLVKYCFWNFFLNEKKRKTTCFTVNSFYFLLSVLNNFSCFTSSCNVLMIVFFVNLNVHNSSSELHHFFFYICLIFCKNKNYNNKITHYMVLANKWYLLSIFFYCMLNFIFNRQ